MFDNIAQLENEVQEFQKNILASKDLVVRLSTLIDAINGAQSALSEQAGSLYAAVKDNTDTTAVSIAEAGETVKSSNETTLNELKKAVVELNDALRKENRSNLVALKDRTDEAILEMRTDSQNLLNRLTAQNNTLINSAADTVTVTLTTYSKQMSDTAAQMSEFGKKLDQNTEQAAESVQNAVKDVEKNNQNLNSDIGKKLEELSARLTNENTEQLATADRRISELVLQIQNDLQLLSEKLSENNRELMSHTTQSVSETLTSCSKELTAAVAEMQAAKKDLTEKYSDFTQTLKNTNVDQLYGRLDEMNRMLKQKFMIVMGGIGAAIVVGLLGIFL